MAIAENTISIADFRRLGAMEIYGPAGIVAIAGSREPDPDEADTDVADDHCFTLGDFFAARTKFLRQLWVARQPGVLPAALMHSYALTIAERTVERLGEEGALGDIRLKAALAALADFVAGKDHVRSLEPRREAVQQAILDHAQHGEPRGEGACRIVFAALDPDGHEAGAQAAFEYRSLFPSQKDEKWLHATLLELVRTG